MIGNGDAVALSWVPAARQPRPKPRAPTHVVTPLGGTVQVKRAWHGVIRQHLNAVVRHLDSLLYWNDRQPTTFPLFTAAELNQIGQVITIMENKLSQTSPL